MPWDSVDRYRDEDAGEQRQRSRRRFKIGGRRSTDNKRPSCGMHERYKDTCTECLVKWREST